MPVALIIFFHLATSALTNFWKSAGELATMMVPSAASFFSTMGSFSAPVHILFILATSAGDVLPGASMPVQLEYSKPGTVSAMVGRSGALEMRLVVVTAKGRRRPDLKCGSSVA